MMKLITITQASTRVITILGVIALASLTPVGAVDSAPMSPRAIWLVDIPVDLPAPVILIDGVCVPGNCTFREAVMEATAAGGGTVSFLPPLITLLPPAGGGSPVIIGSNVLIVGFAPGFPIIQDTGNTPTLIMAGNSSLIQFLTVTGSGSDAILITGSSNTVSDSVIVNNLSAGLHISGGSLNTITRNLLGILQDDTCAPNQFGVHLDGNAFNNTISHNRISCNTADGILVDSAPPAWQVNLTTIDTNTIGLDSTDAIAKPNGQNGIDDIQSKNTTINYNLVSGNSSNGIRLTGSEGTKVTLNYIGTDGTGSIAVRNKEDGILIEDAGDDSGLVNNIEIRDGNVISGNQGNGVTVTGDYMDQVTIKGNTIGLNQAGSAVIHGQVFGILAYNTSHVTIGGPDPATDRNVISGNDTSGIALSGVSDILVDSNYIGLDVTGLVALGNGYAGIEIDSDSSNITIGTLPPFVTIPDQYISGNSKSGVVINTALDVTIGPKTFVGVAADNTTPIGNGENGIYLFNTNDVGVYSQVIANNGTAGTYAGVSVLGPSSGVEVHPVAVSSDWKMNITGNSGLPIDLNNDGHTPNDPGDADTGPNTLLNYPEITSLVGYTISGTVCNNCEVHIYRAFNNPSMDGGGGIYLTKFTATGTSWTASLPPDTNLGMLTFVAYDPATGDTSEMSPRFQLYLSVVIRP
jgi:hypothetical protein